MRGIELILSATAAMAAMLGASATSAAAQGFFDGCVLIGFTVFDGPVFVCDTFDETSPALAKRLISPA